MKRWLACAAGLAATGLRSGSASAWEIADPEHHDCHERLAAGALAQTGYLANAPPDPNLSQDESAFLDDGDFAYTYDRNMQAAALITGVRSNDLDGSADFDPDALAAVLNNPTEQGAHCLRTQGDVGAAGDASSLAACQTYISHELATALTTQGADGTIDPTATEPVSVFVPFQGTIRFPLSTLWFHAGRALHAIQDSFAHTFRDPSWQSPESVLNWVDQVRGDLVETRNGHGHESELDDCTSQRPSRVGQQDAAERASVEFLQILIQPATPDDRQAQIQAFLQRWFSLQPGCNLNDAYCANVEYQELKERWSRDYPTTESSGCNTGGNGGELMALAVLIGLGTVRRRRVLGAVAVATALVGAPAAAKGDEVSSNDPIGLRYVGRASLSIDNPAFAYGIGALWQFERWDLGVVAEHNPWIDRDRKQVTLGALNVYAIAGWRYPLSTNFTYRAGLNLGAATLLVDTVGSSPGQVGVFAGLEPLTFIYTPEGAFAYEFSAFTFDLPEVQFRGWPFGYPQYRLNFGIRFH